MIIEKTQSNEKPANYWLEKLNNGNVDLYFAENIETTDEGYEFNLYHLRTKWLDNLPERIEANKNDFILQAKKQTLQAYYEPKITKLKEELAATDYKAIKYAEGFIDAVDYEPVKIYRNGLREQIRMYENEMNEMEVQ